MRTCMKIMILSSSIGLLVGFAPNICSAQSSPRAAWAAKQQIKARLLSAISDGKISQKERRNILENAKDTLNSQEYFGLVQTVNRLSPSDRATPNNLGYTPIVDKQLMANFPTVDLPWMAKLSKSDRIPGQNLLKEATPNKDYIVRET